MRVLNVKKTYRAKGVAVEALKGISFSLPAQGMVFLLGKSGSGKSTLMNILGGLDTADSGEMEVCGKRLDSLSSRELNEYRNYSCGFVFQEYNLIPELNVGENVMIALQLQGQKNPNEEVKKALAQVELAGYENRKVTELSGGQRQRVAIARALVKNPDIILADEPTGALDGETGESIWKLLREISREKLVVAVSHDRDFAERYGDRIIELADGKVISDSGKNVRERQEESKKKTGNNDYRLLPRLKSDVPTQKSIPFV